MNEQLVWLIGGLVVGHVIGLVLLLFFQDEIFGFLDRLVLRVRRLCGLDG